MMSDHIRNCVDLCFRRFAESLKCPVDYCAEGKQLVDKVWSKIAEKTIFSLGEGRVGGSVGKKTDVIAPDFDLIICVNGETPPFKNVLDDFHNILLLHEDELKIQSGSIELFADFCLIFSFRNGIEVNLFPACNLPLEDIRKKMLCDKSKSQRFSSSLVEEAVAFMKAQDGFTHSIARLGKFWFKSCHFGEKVSGWSTMIELISVAAAMKEFRQEEKSELRALTRVVEMVRDIDKLKIVFKVNSDEKWELIPVKFLNRGEIPFGKWGLCNRATLQQRNYFIIEPTNPLNDLLRDKSQKLIEEMKKYAEVTSRRLDDFWMGKYLVKDNAGRMYVQFEKLFEPQPFNLTEKFPTGVPSNAQLYWDNSCASIYPGMKVVNDRVLERVEVKAFLDVMKGNLVRTVKASQGGTFSEVYSSVEHLIETNLQVKLDPRAGPKDFDVYISVPFRVQGKIQSARLGLVVSFVEYVNVCIKYDEYF